MDRLYRYNNDRLDVNRHYPECMLIAHAGLFTDGVIQNTIAAYKKAADDGFNWLEIDVRVMNDGSYVMSHNDSITLYRNGSSVSVVLSNSSYSNILGLTWDSAGKYPICTLDAVFRSLRLYPVKFIIDRKSGTNRDIIKVAKRCGAVDRILISYGSFAAAYDDRELLNEYPYIPVRIYPNDYANAARLIDAVDNPLYADTNVSGLNNYTYSTPLAYGIPFIFSGCELSTKNKWAALASGVMFGSNINHDNMQNELDVDFDVAAAIDASSNNVSISVGGSATVTATSSVITDGGYIYGFTEDPLIAPCKQTGFGSSCSITVEGRSIGTTNLILFTPSGTIVTIPVTVS